MPTAGLKTLICLKKSYAFQAFKLDEIGIEFEEKYCKGCNDRGKRDSGWKWSSLWQGDMLRKEEKALKEFDDW